MVLALLLLVLVSQSLERPTAPSGPLPLSEVEIPPLLLTAWQAAPPQGLLDRLSITVLLREVDTTGDTTRLWIQIKNDAASAQVLCRSGWGYSWIAPPPSSDAAAEATSSLHGCGDDDHDGLWMLLAGESRFDSYEIKTPPHNAELSVDVEVVGHAGQSTLRRQLTWKGRAADALENARKLKMPGVGGRLQ
jgi:hypothetical protein